MIEPLILASFYNILFMFVHKKNGEACHFPWQIKCQEETKKINQHLPKTVIDEMNFFFSFKSILFVLPHCNEVVFVQIVLVVTHPMVGVATSLWAHLLIGTQPGIIVLTLVDI